MADTNFSQFDGAQANMETDSAYQADAQRSGGATTGSIFASILANKFFYQQSTFTRAFAIALANKGYSPKDGSAPYVADTSASAAVTALAAVFANIVTFADMTASAIFAALGFVPVQQGGGLNMDPANPKVLLGKSSTTTNRARLGIASTDCGDLAVLGQDTFAGQPAGLWRWQMGGPSGGAVVFSVPFFAPPLVFLGNINGSVNIVPGSITANGFSLNVSSGSSACWLAIGAKA